MKRLLLLISVDLAGNLFISDSLNLSFQRLRLVLYGGLFVLRFRLQTVQFTDKCSNLPLVSDSGGSLFPVAFRIL